MSNIKAGADIHAGAGGYSEGTKEGYEAFVKLRKDNIIKSLAQEAGFCFFTAEEDADEPIDWSCDYEEEFQKFVLLLTKQVKNDTVAKVVSSLHDFHRIANTRHEYYLVAAKIIQEDLRD